MVTVLLSYRQWACLVRLDGKTVKWTQLEIQANDSYKRMQAFNMRYSQKQTVEESKNPNLDQGAHDGENS